MASAVSSQTLGTSPSSPGALEGCLQGVAAGPTAEVQLNRRSLSSRAEAGIPWGEAGWRGEGRRGENCVSDLCSPYTSGRQTLATHWKIPRLLTSLSFHHKPDTYVPGGAIHWETSRESTRRRRVSTRSRNNYGRAPPPRQDLDEAFSRVRMCTVTP